MRWSGQELGTETTSALPGLAQLNNLVRSVQTPEFAGVTFHEVLAKSALNKVPGQSEMPFGWTINPYRGCSHACVYCLGPETLILMADGRQQPLWLVEPGDEIVGTELTKGTRRYVKTTVRASWNTRKAAYRVRLADGTELVASGDHRFLTEHGWKFVTGAVQGEDQRPTLTTSSRLMGFGLAGLTETQSSKTWPEDVFGQSIRSSARLDVQSIEPIGMTDLIDITTGTGDFVANGVISHNCFARPTHEYLELDAGRDFDTQVIVKVNVAEVVAKELAKPSWGKHPVALGTNTDPYQRAEGKYKLMPGIIGALADSGTPFSILTKGTLLRRDLPLLAEAAQRVPVDLAMSIAIFDDELQHSIEPGTPTATARLATVTAARDQGFDVSVFMMPILPYLTDSVTHLDDALTRIAQAGATSVLYSALHLKAGVKPWYMQWLARAHPELVDRYEELYRTGMHAPKEYRRWLAARIRPLIRAHGLERGREDPTTGGVRSSAIGMMRNDEGERVSIHKGVSFDDLVTSGAPMTGLQVQPTLF